MCYFYCWESRFAFMYSIFILTKDNNKGRFENPVPMLYWNMLAEFSEKIRWGIGQGVLLS